jgi:hypothetical protein
MILSTIMPIIQLSKLLEIPADDPRALLVGCVRSSFINHQHLNLGLMFKPIWFLCKTSD